MTYACNAADAGGDSNASDLTLNVTADSPTMDLAGIVGTATITDIGDVGKLALIRLAGGSTCLLEWYNASTQPWVERVELGGYNPAPGSLLSGQWTPIGFGADQSGPSLIFPTLFAETAPGADIAWFGLTGSYYRTAAGCIAYLRVTKG